MISIYQTKEKSPSSGLLDCFLINYFLTSVSVDKNSDRHEGDIDD